MKHFGQIDNIIDKGKVSATRGNHIKSCDIWLNAWDLIKELFIEGIAADIEDLNKKYEWIHWPTNFVQQLEMELDSAGSIDKSYYRKRIDYCRELLQWCGEDERLITNTKIAIAESYFEIGEESEGNKLFEEWLREDPDWGWGYVGWFECQFSRTNLENLLKAEEILLAGYSRSEVRDRKRILERLVVLYDETGDTDKARRHEKELKEMQQVRVVKVGRNEPCPCGSGKKYKKCCLP